MSGPPNLGSMTCRSCNLILHPCLPNEQGHADHVQKDAEPNLLSGPLLKRAALCHFRTNHQQHRNQNLRRRLTNQRMNGVRVFFKFL